MCIRHRSNRMEFSFLCLYSSFPTPILVPYSFIVTSPKISSAPATWTRARPEFLDRRSSTSDRNICVCVLHNDPIYPSTAHPVSVLVHPRKRLRTSSCCCLHIKPFFYPTTSAVPPVSFVILHPREIHIMWSDSSERKNKSREVIKVGEIKCSKRTGYESTTKKTPPEK